MLKNFLFGTLLKANKVPSCKGSSFHTTIGLKKEENFKTGGLTHWDSYNRKIYPPQSPDETPRPAFVCHCRENIKYSYKKLWYIASLVRGMTVDEALKQLQFVQKKGAVAVREVILEAQKKAVEEHNVEFKSNLWVSESFVGKGIVIKGLRRGGRGSRSVVKYKYTHYFVTLEEGTPPKDYYYFRRQKSGEEMLQNWLQEHRNKKILNSL